MAGGKQAWPSAGSPDSFAAPGAGEGRDMIAGSDEADGLTRGVVRSARTIAFGTSIVAPSASAATVLILVVACAGFASPLVVLITFAGSLCCALSIGQFAGQLPSAGWAYTYNSRGLGPAAGFLTGLMMIFAPWTLFIVVETAAVFLAYLGITTSASVDLLLVAGEIAVIAALAITILVKIGPAGPRWPRSDASQRSRC
jgi:amino acid transporter